ncbi:MAG TPA: sugar phosphate isomerase/epimerase [Tepidisphaeraceae bacterium]|jgi:sugar phosphate isomerase/epimerase|nr:sugar phosphate isomerase/epimerase [Tepidisphaeraceae bacterium]
MDATPLRIAAFADEISPDIDEQIRVCMANGVTHFELRGVANRNVLDFDRELKQTVKKKITDAGMGVAGIGSPIGKTRIDEAFAHAYERFKIAVESAEFFGAPMIRLFSFYPPKEGEAMRPHRDEVLRRMSAFAEYVKDRPVTLVHENEKHIYGEKGAECVDLMKSVNSPKLRSAFDFANFVQAGEKPQDNWPALRPFVTHIHIKDARLSDGKVVPAGIGDGHVGPILADAYSQGYRGFVSLEPHLAAAGQFSGFSGPKLFGVAADALKSVCREFGVPLTGNSQ